MTQIDATPDDPAPTPSPNDRIADDIADALVDAGLIPAGHGDALREKLKAGGVKQEDWNLWVDLATSPEAQRDGGDANG